jgi:hypothetical protein
MNKKNITAAKIDIIIIDNIGRTYEWIPRGIYFCTLRINNVRIKTAKVVRI